VNPNLCRIVLRPRGPLETFDLTFRVLRASPGPFVRVAIVVAAPVLAVAVPLGWWLAWHWSVALGVLVASAASRPVFTLVAGRVLFDEHLAVAAVLRGVAQRAVSLPLLWLVQAVSWLLGALSCGVLLPIIGVSQAFVPEAVMLEGVSLRRATRRSGLLVSGGFIQGMAAVVGSLFLSLWITAMAEASGQAVVGYLFQAGQPLGSVLGGQATPFVMVGILISQPVIAMYRLLLYVDARTRTEGWDLQVSLRALGLSA